MLECVENAIKQLKLLCFIIILLMREARRKGSVLSLKIVSCMKFNPFFETHFLHSTAITANVYSTLADEEFSKPIKS